MVDTVKEDPATELRGERRLAQRLHSFSNTVQSYYYSRTEQPLGIALPEWRVLRAAILQPMISQTEVATGAGINVMSVNRAVASLKRKGLLESKVDPEDRRKAMLSATHLGREMANDMAEREQVTYEHIFSVLSPAEQALLDELLDRINTHVQDHDLPETPTSSRDWAALFDPSAAADLGAAVGSTAAG